MTPESTANNGLMFFTPNLPNMTYMLESPNGVVGREMTNVAQAITKRAKHLLLNDLLAYDTGEMFDSTRTQSLGKNGWAVIADTEYAIYVHEGTDRMPARPFLTRAMNEVMRERYS